MIYQMKRILVIDDDKASCELLSEILTSQGWLVETADSPHKALDLSERGNFDLVISDINLESDLSGLDLLRQLRDKSPVILVTGFGSLEAAVEANREGAWDFISKPFKVNEIVATAKRALEKNKQFEEFAEQTVSSGMMIGHSPQMIELYKEIARFRKRIRQFWFSVKAEPGKNLWQGQFIKIPPVKTILLLP